jgi:hypothetical protein
MRTLIEKYEWVVVTSIFLLVTAFLLWLTSSINGPFIFADEAEYHWLASEIYNSRKFYGHQYNPLYPLLISPTFYFNDLATHFYAIKLLNIAVYVSIIFPVYLIGRVILASKPLAILLAFIATLGPISAYSHLVWADPLYYTLICWSYYFIVRYLTREEDKDIFYAGVLIGLSFLAKQAALLLLISYYVYIGYAAFSETRKFDKKAIGLISAGAALIVLPWIIRNTFFGESAIGYSSMFSVFFEALKHDPLHIATEFIRGIGYSVGYWVFVYFGAGFFLLLFAAFRSDRGGENGTVRASALAKIVLMHSMLLMLVSELFLVAYGKTSSANGRYVDVIYPVAIIVIAWAILRLQRISLVVISGSAVVCFVLLLLFSPLTQVEAYGVVNNSGVSILNFFWPNQFLWGTPNTTITEKIILSATLTALLVAIFALRKNAIWIICLCGLLLGMGAQLQMIRLGSTGNPIAGLILKLDKQHISSDNVAIDTVLQESSITWHMKFWHPTNFAATKFIDPNSLVGKIRIDFGRQENKAGSDELKIWAPWNPESGFNETFGLGFSEITTLGAAKCSDRSKQGDFVFDHKPLEFSFHLVPGSYVLRGKSADSKCLDVDSKFIVQVQDADSVELHQNTEFILPFEVGNGERGLKMSLKPAAGFVWALDEISIEPQNKKLNQGSVPQFLLTKRLLPLPQVFNVDVYRLYKTQASF